jgi:hypothetical protein
MTTEIAKRNLFKIYSGVAEENECMDCRSLFDLVDGCKCSTGESSARALRLVDEFLCYSTAAIVSEYLAASAVDVFYTLLSCINSSSHRLQSLTPYDSCEDLYSVGSIITSYVMDVEMVESKHICGIVHPLPLPLEYSPCADPLFLNAVTKADAVAYTRRCLGTDSYLLHRQYRWLIPGDTWDDRHNHYRKLNMTCGPGKGIAMSQY